jgi:hypothetical protein
MQIDPVIVGPVSALLGAFIGGGTSLIAAFYSQRCQNRLQRIAHEITKRETVYAEFVMNSSNLLIKAYTHDEIVLSGDEQRMIGLVNRMRIFATPQVVAAAEAVVKAIAEISLKPGMELRQLVAESLSKNPDPDPFRKFSMLCRKDLDDVRRNFV